MFVRSAGNEFFSSIMLEVFAMMMNVEKIRFPQRQRRRNNSTVNLYCDASSFHESLKKHPGWNQNGEGLEDAIPKGKLALSLFPDLIKLLKASYLSGSIDDRKTVFARLFQVAESIGFRVSEDWNDVTKTLFVLIRSKSGKVVLDLDY